MKISPYDLNTTNMPRLSKSEKNYVIRDLASRRKWKVLISHLDCFMKTVKYGDVFEMTKGGYTFKADTSLFNKNFFYLLTDILSNLKIHLENLEEELLKPENKILFTEAKATFCYLMVILMEPFNVVIIDNGRVLMKSIVATFSAMDIFYKDDMLRVSFRRRFYARYIF